VPGDPSHAATETFQTIGMHACERMETHVSSRWTRSPPAPPPAMRRCSRLLPSTEGWGGSVPRLAASRAVALTRHTHVRTAHNPRHSRQALSAWFKAAEGMQHANHNRPDIDGGGELVEDGARGEKPGPGDEQRHVAAALVREALVRPPVVRRVHLSREKKKNRGGKTQPWVGGEH